jgi:DNA-binding NtrC family response regulator
MASVLVVDDDRVVSHLVSSLLREKGHKVITAFDAVQAQGAAAVLSKPLVPEELFLALAAAL